MRQDDVQSYVSIKCYNPWFCGCNKPKSSHVRAIWRSQIGGTPSCPSKMSPKKRRVVLECAKTVSAPKRGPGQSKVAIVDDDVDDGGTGGAVLAPTAPGALTQAPDSQAEPESAPHSDEKALTKVKIQNFFHSTSSLVSCVDQGVAVVDVDKDNETAQAKCIGDAAMHAELDDLVAQRLADNVLDDDDGGPSELGMRDEAETTDLQEALGLRAVVVKAGALVTPESATRLVPQGEMVVTLDTEDAHEALASPCDVVRGTTIVCGTDDAIVPFVRAASAAAHAHGAMVIAGATSCKHSAVRLCAETMTSGFFSLPSVLEALRHSNRPRCPKMAVTKTIVLKCQ